MISYHASLHSFIFARGSSFCEVNFGASEGWGFCKFHKQTAKDGTIAGVMARLRLEAVEVAPVAQRMQTGYHALHSLLGWGSGGGDCRACWRYVLLYAIIANEVTDRNSNKEILLVCLRYLNLASEIPTIEETFIESVQFKGRATGDNIGKQIIEILTANKIKLGNCCAQAYDGAKVMSSEVRGARAKIKEHQPEVDCT